MNTTNESKNYVKFNALKYSALYFFIYEKPLSKLHIYCNVDLNHEFNQIQYPISGVVAARIMLNLMR